MHNVQGLSVAATIAMLSLAGCGEGRDVRQWTPADHSMPEGAADAPETGASREQVGAILFGARCAPCHGDDGAGDGPAAPPVATLPDLTSTAFQDAKRRDGRRGRT